MKIFLKELKKIFCIHTYAITYKRVNEVVFMDAKTLHSSTTKVVFNCTKCGKRKEEFIRNWNRK